MGSAPTRAETFREHRAFSNSENLQFHFQQIDTSLSIPRWKLSLDHLENDAFRREANLMFLEHFLDTVYLGFKRKKKRGAEKNTRREHKRNILGGDKVSIFTLN